MHPVHVVRCGTLEVVVSKSPLGSALPFCALCLLLLGTCLPGPGYAQSPEPFVGRVPGTEFVVTVTEGPGEPRSIGSYAIRLYSPYDPAWPYDNFTGGMVRTRDGGVESLLFEDFDGDAAVDVVVVVRSAGSGGYLFADGYRVVDGRLDLAAQVEGLDWNADPVAALRTVVAAGRQN